MVCIIIVITNSIINTIVTIISIVIIIIISSSSSSMKPMFGNVSGATPLFLMVSAFRYRMAPVLPQLHPCPTDGNNC